VHLTLPLSCLDERAGSTILRKLHRFEEIISYSARKSQQEGELDDHYLKIDDNTSDKARGERDLYYQVQFGLSQIIKL